MRATYSCCSRNLCLSRARSESIANALSGGSVRETVVGDRNTLSLYDRRVEKDIVLAELMRLVEVSITSGINDARLLVDLNRSIRPF
ncbi:hypothetical protein V6N11_021412 [Hibiscus sabdariffa]|uniref:Uncharacterized protein n=1 Tax=Hibiscus sabdariffa TaxID=183260 RepID=A0ABR1ZYB2_9ROSI